MLGFNLRLVPPEQMAEALTHLLDWARAGTMALFADTVFP